MIGPGLWLWRSRSILTRWPISDGSLTAHINSARMLIRPVDGSTVAGR
ncbi:hypothetical protein OG225_12050 [Nocardia sp. NBC_01377]